MSRLRRQLMLSFSIAQDISTSRRKCVSAIARITQKGSCPDRKLGTIPSQSQHGKRRQEDGCQRGNITPSDPPATTANTYELPAPTWSLSDLNVANNNEEEQTARAKLSPHEVAKLCALAHIDLSPSGGDSDGSDNFDVAAVQRDVGAMLRCMQTMRRDRVTEKRDRDGRKGRTGEDKTRGDGDELQDGGDGPWGGAVPWVAPLREDVVSDGDIQEKVLGAAKRTDRGFFITPRVVE